MIREQYFNWDNIKLTSTSNNKQNKKVTGVTGKAVTDAEFKTFKRKLAQQLGFKLTTEKSRFLDAWRRAENTNAKYNPFATTWPGKNKTSWSKDDGMTQFNSAGVKNFSNMWSGIEATIDTLNQSYYTDLVSQLKQDGITAAELAVNPDLRKWGTTSSNPNLIKSLLKTSSDTIDDIDIETKTTTLDELIDYNAYVMKVWNEFYKVFTVEPERYFGNFKGVVNDDEQEAYDFIINEWNQKFVPKLLRIKNNIQKYKTEFKTEVYYIETNISRINGICGPNGIPSLILEGSSGSINEPYNQFYRYDINSKKWIIRPYPFKWDYM